MIETRPTRWDEARSALADLRVWLDEAERTVAGSVALIDSAPHALAPADDADAEARAAALAFDGDSTSSPAAPANSAVSAPIDLFTLAGELTALRHEVKLQTRSARQDREQAAKSLELLGETVGQIERQRLADESRLAGAVEGAAARAAETLVDLHDALSRAAIGATHAVEAARANVRPAADVPPPFAPAPAFAPPPAESPTRASGFWAVVRDGWNQFQRTRRALVSVTPVAPVATSDSSAPPESNANAIECVTASLESLLEGYALGLSRLERALAEHGIEPIECAGQPLDPEIMEAVESVEHATLAPGTVVSEVRRGYRRHGRVLRYAQVVVARAPRNSKEAR